MLFQSLLSILGTISCNCLICCVTGDKEIFNLLPVRVTGDDDNIRTIMFHLLHRLRRLILPDLNFPIPRFPLFIKHLLVPLPNTLYFLHSPSTSANSFYHVSVCTFSELIPYTHPSHARLTHQSHRKHDTTGLFPIPKPFALTSYPMLILELRL